MPRRPRTLQSTGQAARAAAPNPTPSPPPGPPSDTEITGEDGAEQEMEDMEGVIEPGELVDVGLGMGIGQVELGPEEEEDEDDEDDETYPERPPFDPTNLKEIGNLASWTVSTCKPGCGVEALRDEDPNLFWQSDGPQPHLLNVHFTRLVAITHIRLYLDFTLDESYTPTRLYFLAGTSHHDLQEFVELSFEQPKGWIDVDLSGVGGRSSRDRQASSAYSAHLYPSSDEEEDEELEPVLRAHLVQVRIAENHQNGKDTHVRGLQIFARDDSRRRASISATPAPGLGHSPRQRSIEKHSYPAFFESQHRRRLEESVMAMPSEYGAEEDEDEDDDQDEGEEDEMEVSSSTPRNDRMRRRAQAYEEDMASVLDVPSVFLYGSRSRRGGRGQQGVGVGTGGGGSGGAGGGGKGGRRGHARGAGNEEDEDEDGGNDGGQADGDGDERDEGDDEGGEADWLDEPVLR